MDWNGSSVNQKVWAFFYSQEKQEELITQGVSRNGTKSVVLTNKFVGVGNIGSNAPAFRMPSEDGTNVRHPQREMKTPT